MGFRVMETGDHVLNESDLYSSAASRFTSLNPGLLTCKMKVTSTHIIMVCRAFKIVGRTALGIVSGS